MVIIDTSDENGAEGTRAPVLEALIANDGNLPGNLRILLTSRPMVDISEVLGTTQHVHTAIEMCSKGFPSLILTPKCAAWQRTNQ